MTHTFDHRMTVSTSNLVEYLEVAKTKMVHFFFMPLSMSLVMDFFVLHLKLSNLRVAWFVQDRIDKLRVIIIVSNRIMILFKLNFYYYFC